MPEEGEEEKTYDIVKVFAVGHPDSNVLTVPVDLRNEYDINPGDKCLVKFDKERKRIIYELL